MRIGWDIKLILIFVLLSSSLLHGQEIREEIREMHNHLKDMEDYSILMDFKQKNAQGNVFDERTYEYVKKGESLFIMTGDITQVVEDEKILLIDEFNKEMHFSLTPENEFERELPKSMDVEKYLLQLDSLLDEQSILLSYKGQVTLGKHYHMEYTETSEKYDLYFKDSFLNKVVMESSGGNRYEVDYLRFKMNNEVQLRANQKLSNYINRTNNTYYVTPKYSTYALFIEE